MKYFLWINGKQKGPYDPEQIREMLERCSITAVTLGHPEGGTGEWSPISEFPGVIESPKPSESASSICQRCGEHIAFPTAMQGQNVPCPHCGKETTLIASSAPAVGDITKEILEPDWADWACQRCGKDIAFPTAKQGEDVTCPHCGLETTLIVSSSPKIKQHPSKLKIATCFAVAILLIIVVVNLTASIKRNHEAKLQSAELQTKRQAAIQQICHAIAALKICTQGSTYSEFRQRKLDLETCYESNRPQLSTSSNEIEHLTQLADACDHCWSEYISGKLIWNSDGVLLLFPYKGNQGNLDAMKIITPSITNKLAYTTDEMEKDPDFYAKNYVRRGLAMINLQCDDLLQTLQK